jgi:hypothetical protein
LGGGLSQHQHQHANWGRALKDRDEGGAQQRAGGDTDRIGSAQASHQRQQRRVLDEGLEAGAQCLQAERNQPDAQGQARERGAAAVGREGEPHDAQRHDQ